MSYPERVLSTPWGDLEVWATSATHIGLSTRSNTSGVSSCITLNRVDYTLRIDIQPTESLDLSRVNEWAYDQYKGWSWRRSEELALRRVDWVRFNDSYASPSARKKAIEIVKWLIDWVKSEPGQVMLKQVNEAEMRKRLRDAQDRVDHADEALKLAREELRQAQRVVQSLTPDREL